jgi:hypothetical protein
MYSRNTKTTNEPTASIKKSDRPQVKIWDTYIIIETKEFARIGYNGFLFPHEYSGEGRGA